MHSKPHSIMGVPEAEKVLRLLASSEPSAQGELNGMSVALGLATRQDDAATVRQRLQRHADDAIRWHGQPAAA